MKPRPPKEVKSDDLFRSRLTQIINTRHELARLTEQIDWAHIDQQVQQYICWGTPQDYQEYQYWLTYFKKYVSAIGRSRM